MNVFLEYLYDVRWRLEWNNGRPPKTGFWTWPGHEANPDGKAWAQPKEGLARAVIEAQCRFTHKTVVLAECLGQDFIEFKWIAAVMAPLGAKGAVTLTPGIQGMSLVSRHEKVHAYVNGRVAREPNLQTDVRSYAWKF